MTLTNQQITFDSANDHVLRYTVRTTDDVTSPPLDLTNAILQWSLSEYVGVSNDFYPASILEKCTNVPDHTISIVDAPAGIVDVVLSSAETEPLLGRYYHQLRLVNNDIADVVANGTINIERNVVTVC